MIDPNLATVMMLVQGARSLAFLQALYDQSAQLLTLSTATAAIFVSLSDKDRLNRRYLWFGLVALGVSAGVAVAMLTWLTKLMGVNKSYKYEDLSKSGWPFSTEGLVWLHWFHWISLVLLAGGVCLFVLAKLRVGSAGTRG